MIKLRALHTKTIWRVWVVWSKEYFQILWATEWKFSGFKNEWYWDAWKPILTFGKEL
jgi:hypothetical protein